MVSGVFALLWFSSRGSTWALMKTSSLPFSPSLASSARREKYIPNR